MGLEGCAKKDFFQRKQFSDIVIVWVMGDACFSGGY